MRTSTTVNAGSMADIAFLMLIFFLTTTTIATDKGLDQTLPQPCEQGDCSSEIAERNIFQISVNGDGDYLIQNQKMQLSELKQKLIGRSFMFLRACLYLFILTGLFADPVTISGILQSTSGKPVKKAIITLRNLKDKILLEAKSNRKGKFLFEGVDRTFTIWLWSMKSTVPNESRLIPEKPGTEILY